MKKNQYSESGFAQVLLLVVVLVIAGVFIYFVIDSLHLFNSNATPSPATTTSTAKSETTATTIKQQEVYDKYKDNIKENLNLSEKEFQTLRRFSSDE